MYTQQQIVFADSLLDTFLHELRYHPSGTMWAISANFSEIFAKFAHSWHSGLEIYAPKKLSGSKYVE